LLIQFSQKTYIGNAIKTALVSINKLFIFVSNEFLKEKFQLDNKSKYQIKKSGKRIANEEDIDVGTLPFYTNENEKTSTFPLIEYFKNKFKDNFIIGENRFSKIIFSDYNFMNTGLFGRKTEFNLKKRMKLFYIYLFPYLYLFYRIFLSKILVFIIIF
jgi:hypothetical protein